MLLREDFETLDAWRTLTFPKIHRHSTYDIVAGPGEGESWLRAESDRSASGIVWRERYDVFEHPRLRWRWRVENVYEKGDARSKAGRRLPHPPLRDVRLRPGDGVGGQAPEVRHREGRLR